ncbi:hypothetical protein PspLS_07689 [Pyricularia sp. CBS 133598]|nr:hypothetical protein PspLS_07689 [Pyricularia sp. CBS 133598]
MQFSRVLAVLALGVSVNALPTADLSGGSGLAAQEGALVARGIAYQCSKCQSSGWGCTAGYCVKHGHSKRGALAPRSQPNGPEPTYPCMKCQGAGYGCTKE